MFSNTKQLKVVKVSKSKQPIKLRPRPPQEDQIQERDADKRRDNLNLIINTFIIEINDEPNYTFSTTFSICRVM